MIGTKEKYLRLLFIVLSGFLISIIQNELKKQWFLNNHSRLFYFEKSMFTVISSIEKKRDDMKLSTKPNGSTLFLLAFTLFLFSGCSAKIKKGSFILKSKGNDTFLFNTKTGELWQQGGVLNGKRLWHKQNVNVPKEGDFFRKRFRLILMEKQEYYVLDTLRGVLWQRGGNLNGKWLWDKQSIPSLNQKE